MFAVCTGRGVHVLLEQTEHLILVGEPRFAGDVLDGPVGFSQHRFGQFDVSAVNLLQHRSVQMLAESPFQCSAPQRDCFADVIHGDQPVGMIAYEAHRLPQVFVACGYAGGGFPLDDAPRETNQAFSIRAGARDDGRDQRACWNGQGWLCLRNEWMVSSTMSLAWGRRMLWQVAWTKS